MKKNIILASLLAFSMVLFSGCSMKNDFHVTLPNDYKVKELDYALSQVNVQLANEQKKTGDLDVFDTEFADKYEKSLIEVLRTTKIFNNKSDNKINIKVLVLKNDAPSFGFDMTIYTEVEYTIKNNLGKTFYSKIISADGTATAGEKFAGVERMMLANDRAIRNNIKLFLDDIQTTTIKGK